MAKEPGPPADLAAILATLAALAPAQDTTAQLWQQSTFNVPLTSQVPDRTPQPSEILSSINNETSSEIRAIPQQRASRITPSDTAYKHDGSLQPPMVDPATIIEWPQALRCVTKIAAQNPTFKQSIRKMMADQEKHEQMWWQGRRTLLGKHGHPLLEKASDEIRKEIEEYDLKVHTAVRGMFDTMSIELKRLGVPFFGVRQGLVVATSSGTTTSPPKIPGPKTTITPTELLALQKKMIEHLEDMYKD